MSSTEWTSYWLSEELELHFEDVVFSSLCVLLGLTESAGEGATGCHKMENTRSGGIPSKRQWGGRLLANKPQDITCLVPLSSAQ